MYLKSLQLQGFKSFPNRTTLTFENGTTVIVGPNGSGKSNISDAMRWVLGEISSKNLRGSKMEDVIFGGTDQRRPMGFAEVSVTFDNSDKEHRLDSEYDEITVTRRYHRTGVSEYFINHQPCRLRDIHQLFQNTGVGREGYSIIGQGRIAEILSRKSEDRRNIFEEAAGIAGYRDDKEKAEKTLIANDIDLNRLRDQLAGLEERVRPLEREAEKAKKGIEITEQKKLVDVALWLYDSEKVHTDLKQAEDQYVLAQRELEEIRESLESLQLQGDRIREKTLSGNTRAEELYHRITDLKTEISELESAFGNLSGQKSHSEYVLGESEESYRKAIEEEKKLEKTAESLAARYAELESRKKELDEQSGEAYNEQKQIRYDISDIERAINKGLETLETLNTHATETASSIRFLEQKAGEGDDSGSKLQNEIDGYRVTSERLRKEADDAKATADEYESGMKEADTVIEEAKDRIEELRKEKDRESEIIGSLRVQAETLRKKADMFEQMQETFDGYGEGVRNLMRDYDDGKVHGAGKVYGPLSKFLDIKEEYVTAIQTALGQNVQHIVVDNEATVKAALGHLKKTQGGRATFFPITTMTAPPETDEVRRAASFTGYVERADRLVGSDAKFRGIIESLLLRTVVFDTIDNATEAAKTLRFRVKMVTLDGQVINAGGSFTGGSTRPQATAFLSRNAEIEKCRKEAAEADSLIAEANGNILDLNARIEEENDRIFDAEQRRSVLSKLLSAQIAAVERAVANFEANESYLERLEEQLASFESTKDTEQQKLRDENAALGRFRDRITAVRQTRAEQEEQHEKLIARRDELTDEISALNVKATACQKDMDVLRAEMERNGAELARVREQKASNQAAFEYEKKNAETYATAIENNRAILQQKQNEYEEITASREQTVSELREFEKRSEEIRLLVQEKNEQNAKCVAAFEKAEDRRTRLTDESDRIGLKLQEDYGMTYEEACEMNTPEITAQNHAEYVSMQSSYRAKLRAYGEFRPGAIDEYSDVKARYDELYVQVTDLNASCDHLREVILKIEEQMRIDFMTAFDAINRNFASVFAELFGGGQAELSLTDESDVLTSGIEIKAAPPGKIIKSLALLSGGEQTFVAIALLFAMIKVNPTPFCIFDEIEAALDEVNVYRFAAYVRELSKDCQFILITHRRGTMEIGNRLYGVTMPEQGISRVVPLDVNEIEKQKKEAEKWDSSKN